ncbi:MAG TPA: hypothetical protein PKA28_01405 [Methylomusa anaerophila]|uniref:Uncharacterized protein n=1 Tax=Methylomusa anaerophila TaxID=1930071 RepID=A0A348APT1_9FIRM|nr:hypothetical protein [Methylomusa anaerophila]BBB93079.1 hypothetical protein MAMMFC1_03788 [Methylomusa anaerophila]HML87088.1 hypothetical protein [Methylomusa anaerophila]
MKKLDIPLLFRELVKQDQDENIVGAGLGHKYMRGKDTGENAVTVLVRKKVPRNELKRGSIISRKIGNLPTDVIEVGDIQLQNDRDDHNDRTKALRPAQPGVSIGHYKVSAGTFGAVVRDRSTGEILILSNNHVLANLTNGTDGRAIKGDPVLQPGLYDGGEKESSTIAYLHRFIPLYRDINRPNCKIAHMFESFLNAGIRYFQPHYRVQILRESEKLNRVDCAVAVPVHPDAINPEILELGLIKGVKEPQIGMKIKKSGRSTGITSSHVIATDVTFKVGISQHEYGIFTDQVLAGPMSMPGDSGSIILTDDNYAVGLLFAGSEQATMLNKIANVLDSLNIIF